jgi:hypothetical protein
MTCGVNDAKYVPWQRRSRPSDQVDDGHHPASERGSIMAIVSTVTHAGIVKAKRYAFSMF